jgi:hypothetical protein
VNEYLTRLKALNLKKGLPRQPSKPSKHSFEGFEGEPGRGILKNHELVCLHCAGEIGPGSREVTVRSTSDGRLALVHLDCLEQWLHRRPSQWTTGA